jgi:hypothetical protein
MLAERPLVILKSTAWSISQELLSLLGDAWLKLRST